MIERGDRNEAVVRLSDSTFQEERARLKKPSRQGRRELPPAPVQRDNEAALRRKAEHERLAEERNAERAAMLERGEAPPSIKAEREERLAEFFTGPLDHLERSLHEAIVECIASAPQPPLKLGRMCSDNPKVKNA